MPDILTWSIFMQRQLQQLAVVVFHFYHHADGWRQHILYIVQVALSYTLDIMLNMHQSLFFIAVLKFFQVKLLFWRWKLRVMMKFPESYYA